MNDPILSLRIWSYYVLAVGAGLLLVPNQIFDILGIDNTSEVWIRVVGVAVIALGVVYFAAVRDIDLGVVRSSVPGRAVAVIALIVLWLTGGPWQLLIFVLVDLMGMLWSWHSLRTNTSAPTRPASKIPTGRPGRPHRGHSISVGRSTRFRPHRSGLLLELEEIRGRGQALGRGPGWFAR